MKVFISAQIGSDIFLHNEMKFLLGLTRVNFKEVEGSYQGVKEKSFMVELDTEHTLDFFKAMGRWFKQDSILFVNDLNQAVLIFMDNREVVNLGEMKEVSKEVAESSEAFTFIPETNTYLMAG